MTRKAMSTASTSSSMTKGEREELVRLTKARARVAKRGVEQRAAELLADAERQLAEKYKADDAAWADLTTTAKTAMQALMPTLAARCRELGIPEKFRPQIGSYWLERGESCFKERRGELRRVAESRVEAIAQAARFAIERAEVDVLTALTATALTSAQAARFLEKLPSVEALMPVVDIKSLAGVLETDRQKLPTVESLMPAVDVWVLAPSPADRNGHATAGVGERSA
jgi:hypothetical protein